MIVSGEGPTVAVIVPTAEHTGGYTTFESALDALKVPDGSVATPIRVVGSDGLAHGVNNTIAALLADERPPQKFFFIDRDHEFDMDLLTSPTRGLLRHKDAPVVMALTVRKMPDFRPMGFTGSREMWDEAAKRVKREYKNVTWMGITGEHGLVPVEAVGRGGLLVDAGVFRRLPRPWFAVGQVDPEEFLEDVYFSDLCREAGIPVCIDVGPAPEAGQNEGGEPTYAYPAGPVGTGHTSPVSAWPYRYADGSTGLMLRWPNGKTIVFHQTRPLSAEERAERDAPPLES